MNPAQIQELARRQKAVSDQVIALHRRMTKNEKKGVADALEQFYIPGQIRAGQSGIGQQFDFIPGRRIPWEERIKVDYAFEDAQSGEGSVIIPVDGAMIIERVQALWRVTDTDDDHFSGAAAAWNGRVLPCSAYDAFVMSAASSGGATMDDLTDIPEMDLQIITSSTGKIWSNEGISAARYSGVHYSPRAFYGYANAQESLQARVQPRRPMPHAGTVEVVCSGYTILGTMDLAADLDTAMRAWREIISKDKK